MKQNSPAGSPAAEIAAMTALGPGTGSTRIPAWRRRLDQNPARIGDARRSGIGNERDRLPGGKSSHEPVRLLALVVFVEARRRCRDRVVLKKPGGPARVFGRDDGDFTEDPEGA